jgi:hypothetical protein
MPATEEVVHEREAADPAGDLVASVQAKFQAAIDEAQTAQVELAQAPGPLYQDWEVLAWGPWQYPYDPYQDPGRIIFVGEYATIVTSVYLNADMTKNVSGFGAEIQLSYWTSNTQTMRPAADLERNVCIPVVAGQSVYWDYFTFTPSEAACLYEMNICARICNCNHVTVPGYAAFVRHVFDYDPEHLGLVLPSPTPGWTFDRPIRFMVADPKVTCC